MATVTFACVECGMPCQFEPSGLAPTPRLTRLLVAMGWRKAEPPPTRRKYLIRCLRCGWVNTVTARVFADDPPPRKVRIP